MPFEGLNNTPQKERTPFEKMAAERRQDELENAEEAEVVEEEIPEDGNLNLEKISHLELFLESAEDVYADAAWFEAQAMSEGYKSLDVFTEQGDEVEGREVFEVLYEKLQEFQVAMDAIRFSQAPENGYTDADKVPITHEEVEKLQSLYDEMIVLRNHVFSAYRNKVLKPKEEILDPEPEADEPNEKPESPQWEFTSTDYSEVEPTPESDPALESYRAEVEQELRAFLERKGAKRIEGRLQKSVALAESVSELEQIKHNILHSPEFAQNTEAESRLKELKQTISDEYDSITASRKLIFDRFPNSVRTAVVQSVLDILTAFTNRAEIIHQKATELTEQDTSVAQSTLEKYVKNIESISEETERYIEGLSNSEAGMPELDESKEESVIESQFDGQELASKAESKIESVSETATSTSTPPSPESQPEIEPESKVEEVTVVEVNTSKSREADLAQPVTEVSAGEQETPEKRIDRAMNLAYQNMFLSATEMETVKAFQKQVKRLIDARADQTKIDVMVESLESLVSDLTAFPSIEHIPERMQKILTRINAGEGAGSDTKMTANSLAQVVERLLAQRESQETVTEERVVNAYKTLETFVNDNESQWLTVCGMGVPKAGPEGVFGARSFREGLLVARDRHPALTRSLSKQLFLDDIVRMLQTVPNSGLTQEQVDKITWLAREIDVPEKLISAKRAEQVVESDGGNNPSEKASAPKTTSVHIETPAEMAFEMKKRARLAVESEDTETSLEIEVARKAETTIAEEAVQDIQQTIETDQEETPITKKAIFNSLPQQTIPPAVRAAENLDPINEVVPAEKVPQVETREKIDEHSLTRRYLVSSEYSQFISEHYSSPEAFEKVLQIEIQNFDSQHTDKMSEYFGEKRASAFGLLQDMSIEKIRNFYSQPYDEKVAFLREQNVSYDSVMVWFDLIHIMTDAVGENPDMHLGELFAKWMIETEMTYFDGGTSPSQFTL